MTDGSTTVDDVHAPTPGDNQYDAGAPDRLPTHNVDPDTIIDILDSYQHDRTRSELRQQDRLKEIADHDWPGDRLPGFGDDGDDNCGDYIPEATQFCDDSLHVHQNRHVCYQYDCPQHAPAAVRRRVAGTDDASGLAPQLDATAKYLGAHTGDRYIPFHMSIVPPDDYLLQRTDTRNAGKDLVNDLLAELGLQAVVFEHLWSGDHENPDEDDLGKWKQRLPPYHGEPRDWTGDVKDELKHRPHYHAIGVAPDSIDYTWVKRINEETDWVIKYHARNRSDDDKDRLLSMAKRLTYCGSHASVYDARDQRRLAAWCFGPDLNEVAPTDDDRVAWIRHLVDEAAKDTLGISRADRTCHEPDRQIVDLDHDDTLPDVDLDAATLQDAWRPDDIGTTTTTSGGGLPFGSSGAPPDAVAGMASSPTTLDNQNDIAETTTGTTTRDAPTTAADVDADDQDSTDDNSGGDRPECGGQLRHISQAGEYLVDAADASGRVPRDHPAHDLDRAYKSYTRYMEQKDADPLDPDRPNVPELDDDPPPD